ncbi:MAG: response regulator, partial [Cyanobacteria bacterium P01_F01_bin.42]
QTLSHLQQLEQSCYQLMPQFDLEQVLSMVERSHQIKAGAHYLKLNGFEKLASSVKRRYIALMSLPHTCERDLLKQLIQMKELFCLCLLANVDTWQADLLNVVAKLPNVFQTLDQSLALEDDTQLQLPSRAEIEADIQRLLVAVVLIPGLARLDMTLKNTPVAKLSELLNHQLPRLQNLAQQLHLRELQRSMQISLLEIQARPSHAKTIGAKALLKWSDLSYQTLTPENEVSRLVEDATASLTFRQACTRDLESTLTACAVTLIEGNEERLLHAIQVQARRILTIADQFEVADLKATTESVLAALRYHPDQCSLIGRLALQDWLRHQIRGLMGEPRSPERAPHTSDALTDLAQPPPDWQEIAEALPKEPSLVGLLSQVEMPDGFREFTSADTRTVAISSDALENLAKRLEQCRLELETLPHRSAPLEQAFQALRNDYHHLVSIPLSQVFQRFQPMVDALGLQSYKDVVLQCAGGDITIDRRQAEALYELLVPLISNTVVHGLETADERQRQGKSRRGNIWMTAHAQDDDVVIEVRNDGRGLNFEMLREWVIRHYHLSTQAGTFLTEAEILDYVFKRQHLAPSEPQVEDTGLGALRGTLDKLKGSIEVSTVAYQGSTFRILLPQLLLSAPSMEVIEDALARPPLRAPDYSIDVLRHQGQTGPTLQLETRGLFVWADAMSVFVLESDRIEEYVMPHVTAAHKDQQTLSWREETIPIFSLQDFLGTEVADDSQTGLSPNEAVILVLRGEQQFLALRTPMDHLVSASSLTLNPLSQALAAPRYIYGTTQLEEESPRLVIDVAALIAQQPSQALLLPKEAPAASPPSETISATPGPKVPIIMVVDDSRTAREIVSLTLRQGGYEVVQAKDGVDALEQLRVASVQTGDRWAVDLVISDVAMPRMNGLEFLRQCRQDNSLESLPIAMLSNCDSTTHSELALKAGANAYLTKPYVEEVFLADISKLLETIPKAASIS